MSEPLGLVHGGPITDFVREVALPLHTGSRVTAAQLVATYLELPAAIRNDEEANVVLSVFLQFLLDRQRYVDAATILWTANLFSGEPRSVKLLWDAIFKNSAVMVPGAASMGKSYNLGVWCYLDWRRDPEFTNIQLVGPSEKHLEKNLFSHIVKLHNNASIKSPGEVRQLEISVDSKQKDAGIFGVVIPIGQKSAGRLQGGKVVQRPKPHAQFGPLSRVRVMIEEAENVPVGIWEDVTNVLSNTSGVERFKIFCPFNPKDANGPCAQRCEPLAGWSSINIEEDEDWTSKRGWKVVRLDAYKSDNVILGYEKFFGLQTREALEKVIANAGGVNTAGYYTMARGWFPPTGVDLAVIPQHLTNDLFADFHFVESPRPCAGEDVALEGGDNAICVLGRTGLASGYTVRRTALESPDTPPRFVPFRDQFGRPQVREVVQVDQIFCHAKGDTVSLATQILKTCEGAGVQGKLLGIDRTGNGAGVHDILNRGILNGAHGVNGSMSSTERKILEEDLQLPCDEYHLLISEIWFALRKYIEFHFLKISPTVAQDPLLEELTGRRFHEQGAKKKVESKKEYRSRGNKSPDRADALTILLHAVRQNSSGPPSATSSSARANSGPPVQRIGSTDRADYL